MDEFSVKLDGDWIGVTHLASGRLFGFKVIEAERELPILIGGVQMGSETVDAALEARALEVARAAIGAEQGKKRGS